MRRIALTLSLALAGFTGCLPAAQAGLPEPVAALLQSAHIPEDAIGVVVLRGATSLVSHGAGRLMQPASTMKLVTAMVGLDQLGPAFRGRTELRSAGQLAGGVLRGDLVLRGGADPELSTEALERMLRSLRNQGIRKIQGNLIVDRQLFQPARPELGVAAFDESPEFRYNVIPDALLLNLNLLEIDLRAGARQLALTMAPAMQGVTIGSDMTLVDGDCAKWEDGWQAPGYERAGDGKLRVMLHGTFPKNCAKTTSINLLDRQDYADRLFRASWSKLGGSISGKTIEAAAPADTRLLAEHVSRALPDMLRDINKLSDNTLARLLYLSLGSLETDSVLGSRPIGPVGGAATAARAGQAVHAWMERHGIDDAGMVLENGSGLSRLERISAAQMAAVLVAASRSDWSPEFLSSLPIAGLDGTMRKRLHDSPAAAKARIKTGALKNVMAIAGFVPDANNQPCIVVAMINHELVGNGAGRAVLDALIDWVARSGF
jgi:serine-type D-Ala-D-Ala carboxypeptidase/endopeptidase (penicillin-binding protein 4)